MTLFFYINFLVIFGIGISAQPQFWTDVCASGPYGAVCYVWAGAAFPFNSLQKVMNNPECKDNCQIFIIPYYYNCNFALKDVTAVNLNMPCSNSNPLILAGLLNLNIEKTNSVVISSLFGNIDGENPLTSLDSTFVSSLFGSSAKDLSVPFRWDLPFVITTKNLSIATLPNVEQTVIQVWSQKRKLYPSTNQNCVAFQVLAHEFSMKDITFYIDPNCPASDAVIVVMGQTGTQNSFNFTNIIVDYNKGQINNGILFPPKLFPVLLFKDLTASIILTQISIVQGTAFPYAVVAVDLHGSINVENAFGPVFLLGTAIKKGANTIVLKNATATTDIGSYQDCPISPVYSHSNCDHKKMVNTALIITISIVGAVVLIYFIVLIRHNYMTNHIKKPDEVFQQSETIEE